MIVRKGSNIQKDFQVEIQKYFSLISVSFPLCQHFSLLKGSTDETVGHIQELRQEQGLFCSLVHPKCVACAFVWTR